MKEDSAGEKALKQFADLMIQKIKEVEYDWKKPWFSPESGGGLPQNIEGRVYNGINLFMLYLLSEEKGYSTPLYMTFMQAKEAGASIMRGEKSFPVVYWNFSVRDKNGNKISIDDYRDLSDDEKKEYKVTPYMKTYNVFNVSQTNYPEVQPEKWEKLKEQFKSPSLKDEKGMFTMPLLDALIRERQWVCPIYPRESDSAYYRRGEGCHIIVPLKGQFDTGESFYSTLLHEMAHSTGEEGLLGREKGEFFGDKKYAKEELVAELTSATCGKSLGLSTCIREENAMYLKSWLSALSGDPKFIYTILSDVAKASAMIQEKVNGMEPKLTKDEKFLLAASQGNEEQLKELKENGYNPSLLMVERLHINVNSNEGKEAVSKVFGIDIEKGKTVEMGKQMAQSAEITMNI
jgi:antirestriction protein ArdC